MLSRRRTSIAVAALLALPAAGQPPVFDHVVLISVDGLRSDVLEPDAPVPLPNLRRMCGGASTLNARTVCSSTSTLPNHASMLTSRPVIGPNGHQWIINTVTDRVRALDQLAGTYVPGVFDVAHDNGVFTGMFVAKSKMVVFHESWNGTRPPPGDRNRIDEFVCPPTPFRLPPDTDAQVTAAAIESLRQPRERSLRFVHLRDPDAIGHIHDWDVSPGAPYMYAVRRVDRHVGMLLEAIESSPRRDDTVVILTSDHGGSTPAGMHYYPEITVNYTIPLMVWRPGDTRPPRDLYTLNRRTRTDPRDGQPIDDVRPPIRNAEVANLALQLLGLPPVPGSVYNAEQDLIIWPEPSGDDGARR